MGDHYLKDHTDGAQSFITIQKDVNFTLNEGNDCQDTAYFPYPCFPNPRAPFQLCGRFWSFKYYFESNRMVESSSQFRRSSHHYQLHPTKIESDACQMYIFLTRRRDHGDIEFQLLCDSGPKASISGWTLAEIKWVVVKISFMSPETKQILHKKKVEGEPRCGRLKCPCKQTKLCLRKESFCSGDFLQSFYSINKCTKPQHGMPTSYYTSLDATVSITLYPQNPNAESTEGSADFYWKSQEEASKRIFHAKIGTDFCLEVNGKAFPCHKCILAGHSEVFCKMFASPVERKQSAQSPAKLVMEGMSTVGVESFLKYIYYGDTSFSQLPACVSFQLMWVAEKYGIPHLTRASLEVLSSKMVDELDCTTALNMYLFFTKHKHNSRYIQHISLRRTALQFLSTNFEELIKSHDFGKLFAEKREKAQEILIKIHKNKTKNSS